MANTASLPESALRCAKCHKLLGDSTKCTCGFDFKSAPLIFTDPLPETVLNSMTQLARPKPAPPPPTPAPPEPGEGPIDRQEPARPSVNRTPPRTPQRPDGGIKSPASPPPPDSPEQAEPPAPVPPRTPVRPPVRLPLRNPFTWAVEKKEWNGEPYLGDIRGGRPHGLGVTYGPDNRQMVSVWQMGSINKKLTAYRNAMQDAKEVKFDENFWTSFGLEKLSSDEKTNLKKYMDANCDAYMRDAMTDIPAGQVESATLNATREYVDLMLRDWIIGFGKFMPRDFEIKDGKFKTQTPEKTKTHGRTRFRSIRTIKIVPFICALGAVIVVLGLLVYGGMNGFFSGKDNVSIEFVGVLTEDVPGQEFGLSVLKDDVLDVDAIVKKAEKGKADFQRKLGALYYAGIEVEQDYGEAARWFELAGRQGDSLAQLVLGALYYQGIGVRTSYKESLNWFEQAAEQGEILAQYMLGYMYQTGQGVASADPQEALEWYTKAAQQGDALAQNMLGEMYMNGEGVDADFTKALEKSEAKRS